ALQPPADEDGGHVERRDDQNQQHRRRVDHGFGGLAVLALESKVVDVEAKVHERSFKVNERERRVDGQFGGEFDGADEHERRDLARAARHGENGSGHDAGHGPGQNDAANRLPLAGAAGVRALAHRSGDGREGFFGGDDDDGEGEQGEGERGPEDAAGAEGRVVAALGEKGLVDAAADDVGKEPKAEDAEDDAGDAGKVVHGDADGADDGSALGVFAQVQRRQDAEGNDGDG